MEMLVDINNYEDLPYEMYLGKAQLDKAIATLEGILKGISIDNKITDSEVEELTHWCNLNRQYISKSFFKEVIPVIDGALKDNVLTFDEVEDILWVSSNFKNPTKYYHGATNKIQTLHGILHGILADNEITDEELFLLQGWLDDNTS